MIEFVNYTEEEHKLIINHAVDIYIMELIKNGEFNDYYKAKKLALKEVAYFADPNIPNVYGYHLLDKTNPVGYLLYSYNPEDKSAFLGDIYLYSFCREKGYAKKTMQHFEEHIIQLGGQYILLYVFKMNTRAIGLYHRMGYQIAGEYALNEATQPTRYAMIKWL